MRKYALFAVCKHSRGIQSVFRFSIKKIYLIELKQNDV